MKSKINNMVVFYLYLLLITLLEVILFIPLLIILRLTGMKGRLGFGISSRQKSIWFHAASMGEVNALKPLLIKTAEQFGAERIVLTTMTSTGLLTAAKIDLPITVSYLPLDFPIIMSLFFKRIAPQIIVIMETEFWPQMLFQAKLRDIPVIMVNARLTANSFSKYLGTRLFWHEPWLAIKTINAQSDSDQKRFRELGFNHVRNCGNLKFAIDLPDHANIDKYSKYGVSDEDFVLTVGSSRPGEEQLIREIYPHLKKEIPNLKLIIAPRHLKRIEEVKAIFAGQKAVVLSELIIHTDYDILIIDSIGLLTEIYSFSDLVIVGGSFTDYGGHNPLEAAYYSKPVIMGIYHSSCRESVNRLLEKQGIFITGQQDLLKKILELYNDHDLRINTGKNARNVLVNNAHSLEENLDTIKSFLE
ncbi:MAG: glycosyltransferase N-terminal domain-containing protein [Candidatus Stygibacter frigidus]|nr:glycosyltransferase N-terminal domain-containing protein [Candidatus Stygibacter frigidus]